MKILSKNEFERFAKEKYSGLSKQNAIKKMKGEYHVTVLNRGHSKRKSYSVCESAFK